MSRSRRAAVRSASVALAIAAGAAAASAAPPSRADGVLGTYRLHGTARVSARPAIDREVEAHADAVLRPGREPRDVRAEVAAEGHRCELEARVEAGGQLTFAAGQRCVVDVNEPNARGQVTARLRSGKGRVEGGRLTLALAWDVSGSLSLRAEERRIQVLGSEVHIPGGWMPEVPLSGEAEASLAGPRDQSRAANP